MLKYKEVNTVDPIINLKLKNIIKYCLSYPKNDIKPLNLKIPNDIPKIKLIITLNQNILSNLWFFVVSSDKFWDLVSDSKSNN